MTATSDSEKTPLPNESIAHYLQRVRRLLGLSQKEVAAKAQIHVQSLGKIERVQTGTIHDKTLNGLAYALQIPVDHLDSLQRGVAISDASTFRFCPQCWTPGTPPEPLWMHQRARFCFECGSVLRSRCHSCQEPITSLRHRFCPLCGTPYKESKELND
ncbi:helix-turn-helix domain-containing protein (plasmid) [Picosynechococcus sp. PCC 11901]|uniref:double zinc ribbon domain-containing protein n=1 Tax=Picosynechococcus sp. PCC 11901 TaxID=2579791 RepID=UPI0010FBF9A5|nr:zinc ribbon domain-containing protein [Picosynechococcus sp. PCC 11901]QCS48007.1 helix-turn-helix domain-containing protein [Picosynechococcus sp. PCC 11901]